MTTQTYTIGYEPDLIPPPHLMRQEGIDVLEDWFRWAEEWTMILKVFGGLTQNSAVLEIGCGFGRIAYPLRAALIGTGTYNGLDGNAEKVAFVQRTFQRAHPNFKFRVLNSRSPNGNGKSQPNFVLPYFDNSFDIVFAAAEFAHILPENLLHYFKEASRVLKRGGRCMFGFFLLEHYRTGMSRPHGFDRPVFNFDHPYADFGDEFAVVFPREPAVMVSYRLSLIEKFAHQANLRLTSAPVPGVWSGTSPAPLTALDLIVMTKD